MGSIWKMPGVFTEKSTDGLRAFGIDSIPACRVNAVDPSVSQKQQEFMGSELRRKRAGLPTRTNMTEQQLVDFASTPRRGLPKRKGG